MNTLPIYLIAVITGGLLLSGCAEKQQDHEVVSNTAAPANEAVEAHSSFENTPFSSASTGIYEIDPNHASLSFGVRHLGFSNYIARFTKYSSTVNYDAGDVSASSIEVSIDPTSIDTDYTGDYKATHPGRDFNTWEEELANSEKFLNSTQHTSISYRSTAIERTGVYTVRIDGELTLLGQTRPVALDATIVGSAPTHPMQKGRGVFGFSAKGTFNRSDFGMDFLLSPPILGDEIALQFEGEFLQTVAEATDAN